MVTAGLVNVDDMPAEATQRLFRDQVVKIRLTEPPDKLLAPNDIELEVVYEDPWLLVINKQVGLVAHPVGEFQDGTLSNAVQHHIDQQTRATGLLRPGIVHRLDRMTSGLIVVTKEHLAHRLLSIDFQQGRTQKAYLALVEGQPDFEFTSVTLPIGVRPGANSVLMSARPDAKNARRARTDISIIRRFHECCLVECILHTGRNHQIRVHMAEIGHPVLGDEYYDTHGAIRNPLRSGSNKPTTDRHALHASRLVFQHPILKTALEFRSLPTADFWALQAAFTQKPKSG